MKPGSLICGRYQLLELIGEGGMSAVWRAVTRNAEGFSRPVAVKVMKRGFSEPLQGMFVEEARIGAELQHPHLVNVFDFVSEPGVAGPTYFLVMEWVEGMDLRTLIKTMAAMERPLPWAMVAHIGIGVLRGLAAAHERLLATGKAAPVIHRDVSPQNILLGLNGSIKLGDFGMARARDRAAALTAPGVIKGTVSYLAPETLIGKPPTPASDLFSLACTLWEALAGERLYDGPSDVHVVDAIRSGKPIPPLEEKRPDLPGSLVWGVHRALAHDPEKRFASARAMIQHLGEVLRTHGPWVDSDVVIGTTIAQARDAAGRKRPPLPEA